MTNPTSSLSILIITYNRPDDLLELVKNLVSLTNPELLSEIIIVNNHSTADYKMVEEFMAQNSHLPIRYHCADRNLGVAAGRNYAIQKSTGSVLIFLDDDALFWDKDALLQVKKIFHEHKETGIVSFRVFYHSTMDFQKNAFAHKQFEKRKQLVSFETNYFTGCAHAIRKEVFSTAGFYPEDFFYGMEEYDLSYRTVQAGYTIRYDASVTVLHKESPLGRLAKEEKIRGMWVNKSKVAWKYLPKLYFFTTAFLWSVFYLRKTGWNIRGWGKGWKTVAFIPSTVKRHSLSKTALAYLKKVEARLWY